MQTTVEMSVRTTSFAMIRRAADIIAVGDRKDGSEGGCSTPSHFRTCCAFLRIFTTKWRGTIKERSQSAAELPVRGCLGPLWGLSKASRGGLEGLGGLGKARREGRAGAKEF